MNNKNLLTKQQFRRKYHNVKLWKYVPLLEQQLKNTIKLKDDVINSKGDWMVASIEEAEKVKIISKENRRLKILLSSVLIILCLLSIEFGFLLLLLGGII